MKHTYKITTNQYLALSIGIVYLWFGALKFFPELSPAEELAKNTIRELTFNLIPANISIILLAIWEVLVGVFLILNVYRRIVVIIALVHITLTFTPFIVFPDQEFVQAPYQFTLLGQYIFKNVITIGALLVLYEKTTIKHKVN